MSRKTTSTLLLVIGIAGVVLLLFDIVLIVIDPTRGAPYANALAGLCIATSSFLGHVGIRRAFKQQESPPLDPEEE